MNGWILFAVCSSLVAVGSFAGFLRSIVRRVDALETAVVSSVLEESARPVVQAAKQRRTIAGIMTVAGFPSVCLTVIGLIWGSVSTALAVMLTIATVLLSVAIFFIVSLVNDWG